jgi:hypothetical protein
LRAFDPIFDAISQSAALVYHSRMPPLTWPQVWSRRLVRHGLAAPFPNPQPAAIAAATVGAHAQVMAAAEFSIGLRGEGLARDDIRKALWEARTLVKTRGPRGTVHLLPSADLPLWTGAFSALPPGRNPFPESMRLTGEQVQALLAAMDDALADAELTVDELTEALAERAGPWAADRVMDAFQDRWPRWRQMEGTAANRGVLCFGPNRGPRVTYTSPRRWLPGFRPAEGPAALAWLVKQYLHSYGPAAPAHFAQWLNVSPRWAADLFASLGDQLAPVEVGGTAAWVVAGDTAAPPEPPRGVRLLPYFDAYLVGCHPRERLYPGAAGERLRTQGGGQAGTFPVLLVDGLAAGVWHHKRSGRKLAVTVEPLRRLTQAQQRGLDAQVARLGEFLEAAPTLTLGPVTVGTHA